MAREDRMALAAVERMHTQLAMAQTLEIPYETLFLIVKPTASATLGANYPG